MAAALIAGAFPETTLDTRHYAAVAALNLALLGLAFWLALPAIGGAGCLLLFAGPTIWWLDKPTMDVAAFAAIVIAMVLLGWREAADIRSPGPSGPGARADLKVRPSGSQLTAAAIALLLVAILQPAYGRALHWPSLAELFAVPLDPAIGVAANFPWIVLAVGVAIGVQMQRRAALSLDHAAAIVAGIALLFSVAQVMDLHGRTPSLSRYANWFIPLSVPFLRELHARGGVRWRQAFWTFAALSAVFCTMRFHPATAAFAREPTWAANHLWTRHPGWNNPLPEVFSETIHVGEDRVIPAATPGCEKLLVAGAGNGAVFPIPCFPAAPPAECTAAGVLCYANRTDDGAQYRFVRAPGSAARHEGFTVRSRFAWPATSVPHVRDLFTQWQWWTLQPRSGPGGVLREIHDVRVMEMEGERRLMLILRQASPGASIALRPRWKATGVLVDAATGRTLRTLEFNDEPLSRWELEIPLGFDVLLMFLQAS